MSDIDLLVTDDGAPAQELEQIRASGTEVVIATARRAARLAETDGQTARVVGHALAASSRSAN